MKQRFRACALLVATITASTLVTPLAALAASSPAPITDKNTTVTEAEVAQTLSKTEGLLDASKQVQTTSDSSSALKTATAEARITIPRNARDGVTIARPDRAVQAITVSLPNASQSQAAKQVAPGAVAYAGSNGSATAVQATNDGGVRMLTVIDDPAAPTTYSYTVNVPTGGHIELTPEGGAVVVDTQSNVLASVAIPWAKDANGKQIKTYFTTNGQTLTQHIDHNVPGVAYPVTADPSITVAWHGVTVRLTKDETYYLAIGAFGTLGSRFGTLGVFIATGPGSAAADWARKHGYCIGFYHSWVMPYWYSQTFVFKC